MSLFDRKSRNGVSGMADKKPQTIYTTVAAGAPTDYAWRFTNVRLSGTMKQPPIADEITSSEAKMLDKSSNDSVKVSAPAIAMLTFSSSEYDTKLDYRQIRSRIGRKIDVPAPADCGNVMAEALTKLNCSFSSWIGASREQKVS